MAPFNLTGVGLVHLLLPFLLLVCWAALVNITSFSGTTAFYFSSKNLAWKYEVFMAKADNIKNYLLSAIQLASNIVTSFVSH